MAETANVPMPRRYYFSEGIAPFGELNLLRADYDRISETGHMDSTLNVMSGGVTQQAWLGSDWLNELVPPEQIDELKNAVRLPFAKSANEGAIHSYYFPQHQTSWFAVRPPKASEVKLFQLPKNGIVPGMIMPSHVVGFASAKHDVSGSWIQKAIKRHFHPEKVYANISDVDVKPSYQRQRIGAALFFVSLLGFREEQVPTTYVAACNKPLIKSLDRLGYRITGSHTRTDLLPSIPLEEVRLQSDTVADVKQRLVEHFPWLEDMVSL